MNPQTAAPTMPRPMVNDIAVPASRPAGQPSSTLTTNLVANIPVHAPSQPGVPASEDDELDKIMRDVGQELKKDDQSKNKSHFSLFHKQKTAPPARTAAQPAAVLPAVPVTVSRPVQAAAVVQPAVQAQPQPAPQPRAAAKPKRESSAQVLPIMTAVIVTGLLMAAAIYTYK